MAGSLALARAAVGAGVRTLVATPHVSSRYHNEAEQIAALVAEFDQSLVEDDVALELRAGAEVAMTQLAEIEPSELERLHLGGGGWLLLEPPFTPVASAITTMQSATSAIAGIETAKVLRGMSMRRMMARGAAQQARAPDAAQSAQSPSSNHPPTPARW